MGRYKKIVFNKGKIIVVNIGDRVDRIFRMSGLYKIISKCENLEEALESVKGKVDK